MNGYYSSIGEILNATRHEIHRSGPSHMPDKHAPSNRKAAIAKGKPPCIADTHILRTSSASIDIGTEQPVVIVSAFLLLGLINRNRATE